MSLSELMIDIPAEHERNVFGQFDAYAKKLERTFHVTLIAREGKVKILGEDKNAEKARRVLDQLAALSKRGNEITEQNVDYAMSLVYEDQEEAMVEMDRELICHTLQGKPIKPKTLGQKRYVDAIREGMITFGLGPAGTGKTYLAMAMAITAFQRNEVSRIIQSRDHRRCHPKGPSGRNGFRSGCSSQGGKKSGGDQHLHTDEQGCGAAPACTEDRKGI